MDNKDETDHKASNDAHKKAQEFLEEHSEFLSPKTVERMYNLIDEAVSPIGDIKHRIDYAIQKVREIDPECDEEDNKDGTTGGKIVLLGWLEGVYSECASIYKHNKEKPENIFKLALSAANEITEGTELEGVIPEFYTDYFTQG